MGRHFFLFFFLLGLTACTNTNTVNLIPHNFDQRARHIIWPMISGLGEEHLGLLKMDPNSLREKSSFEQTLCFGKFWNYNLFELRPTPLLGFLSQVTGSKNIKNACDGMKQRPIWNLFHSIGHTAVILESGVHPSESFESSKSCGPNDFLSKSALIRMHEGEGKEFHFQREMSFEAGDILYDKSCQKDICFADFAHNAKAIWANLKTLPASIFIIRIEDYGKALAEKNTAAAQKILTKIDGLLRFFMDELEENKAMALVTSSGVRNFEFPERGEKWWDFQNSGRNLLYRRRSLMSPAWAMGLGAENFCGLYEESDIFNRILWRPMKSFIEEEILRIL